MGERRNLYIPKAIYKLEIDLAFPLVTYPREYNTILYLILETLYGVTDNTL